MLPDIVAGICRDIPTSSFGWIYRKSDCQNGVFLNQNNCFTYFHWIIQPQAAEEAEEVAWTVNETKRINSLS